MGAMLNVAAYHFTQVQDPGALAAQLRRDAGEAALKGTVLVASEGINLFLAGADAAVRGFVGALRARAGFEGLQARYSHSAEAPFARLKVKVKPEIISFLSDTFGAYPFDVSGAIVTNEPLFFALETQSRPIYPAGAVDGSTSTLVHELAHQWFGDSLTVQAWRHIWLNEGFATYAEWLWLEDQGGVLTQDIFDGSLEAYPADDPFWASTIGDPGPDAMFSSGVYDRGALTLHALRMTVGDDTFFQILQTWTCEYAGETVTTDDFIAVAEAVSGRDLRAFFDAWLFTPARPQVAPPHPPPVATGSIASSGARRDLFRRTAASSGRARDEAHVTRR